MASAQAMVLVNGGLACSSILIGEFEDSKVPNMRDFVRSLRGLIVMWNEDEENEDYFENHAFVTASTAEYQKGAESCLEDLGFYQTERTYNRKNSTSVIFWMIEIPRLLKNMKEMEQKFDGK